MKKIIFEILTVFATVGLWASEPMEYKQDSLIIEAGKIQKNESKGIKKVAICESFSHSSTEASKPMQCNGDIQNDNTKEGFTFTDLYSKGWHFVGNYASVYLVFEHD